MINPVRPDEWKYYLPLHGSSMFELGGKVNTATAEGEVSYKQYFESIGFRHVSVDFEGKWGALNLDLRKPLWPEFGQFDMVTNIGTTEHVQGQAGVWENIHELTKPGGVLVSVTPLPDGKNWWWHGEYYPTPEFYIEFARLNGWLIARMKAEGKPPHMNIYARLLKRHNYQFTMPPESLIRYNQMRSRHSEPC